MRATALLLVASTSACAALTASLLAPVRASSVPYLGAEGSSQRVARPANDVANAIEGLFDKRGYHLIARYSAKDGSNDSLYAFKGTRGAKTVGDEDEVTNFQLGSVFYVRVHAADTSATDVLLIGKPTIDGQEVCSDADAMLKAFEYWCVDTTVNKLGNGTEVLPQLTGKEEADTIRGVLLDLGRTSAAAQ